MNEWMNGVNEINECMNQQTDPTDELNIRTTETNERLLGSNQQMNLIDEGMIEVNE